MDLIPVYTGHVSRPADGGYFSIYLHIDLGNHPMDLLFVVFGVFSKLSVKRRHSDDPQ